MPSTFSCRVSERCSASPSARSSRSSRGRTPGRERRTPRVSRARGTAFRARPSRRRCRGACTRCRRWSRRSSGLRPWRNAEIDLEQLALVDRAAAQLEVDTDVRRDRRRRLERRDVLGRSRTRRETNSSTSAKFRSAWMPPAVAQAPIVTSAFDARADPLDPLGVLGGRDRALDEREVVRALRRCRSTPRGSGRSRPRRRARAARPRSRAA